ncbi:polysaccharide pyruvyl transferase family protein [Rhizobium sp. LEGMi198b]|uniref:polysaccharide pyruvyl transferase family protein n=1 Tax=unclassified Rhizobium TaxID=2613769 RepID=UPI0021A4F199|nr:MULTISPECIES: polysaccharide pyruvyl transferase family protein [Rhizobium]MDK4740200.1 polysaccharide pyruvyl transferase family protein [Rhizobium sp. CNPSo 3464]UWU24983.1 polysaccharide pyruvyl transferase family protein [Rhizobium tropici]
MKPFHWESTHGNFGDDLNLWLWDFLLPGLRDVHKETLLVGVGTVLNTLILPLDGHKLVIGSGFGYGSLPDMSDRTKWDIRSVRGPLTAEKVGLPQDMGVIDPAVMVTEMPEFKNLPKSNRRTFVPHWESAAAGLWPEICKTVGLSYLDPRGEAKAVIREIATSELIVAESMHGAILADAFRVPWIAVSTSRAINSFKWNDWARSLGVTYAPKHIPVSTRAEAIAKGARFWGVGFERDEHATEELEKHRHGGTVVLADPEQTRLRVMAKQALAVPSALALWQASKAKPQLSADSALASRKQRLFDVIEGVRRDYF